MSTWRVMSEVLLSLMKARVFSSLLYMPLAIVKFGMNAHLRSKKVLKQGTLYTIWDLKSKPLGPRRLFKCWVEDWENVMDQGQVIELNYSISMGFWCLMTLIAHLRFV